VVISLSNSRAQLLARVLSCYPMSNRDKILLYYI